jgi:hypothetical protein
LRKTSELTVCLAYFELGTYFMRSHRNYHLRRVAVCKANKEGKKLHAKSTVMFLEVVSKFENTFP